MRRLVFLLAAAAQFAAAGTPQPPTGAWRIQYRYDRDRLSFDIQDIFFSTPERGIAVGALTRDGGKKTEGLAIVTRDGGSTWTETPLKEPASAVFFVNDSVGWLVTPSGIWQTLESGLSWRKIKNIQGVESVYFLDERHGWAVGAPKLMLETRDGGRTWAEVEAAKQVKSNPEYTVYRWIQFVTPKNGIVGGTAIPPRPFERRDAPAWADPEKAAKHREWPTLSIGLDTADGGQTWKSQTAPVFGIPVRFRFAPDRYALGLIRFENAFEYPSEVYLVAPKNGKSVRTFRDKKRLVTDVGWSEGKHGFLVAIEPPGLHMLPVPGRLHVLESDSFAEWTEMPVDWKAYAGDAVLAVSGSKAWIGTDQGVILTLVRQ